MPDPISKQRRAVRRTNKQQRDHRNVGTQFTRSVNPYVRAAAKRDATHTITITITKED